MRACEKGTSPGGRNVGIGPSHYLWVKAGVKDGSGRKDPTENNS